MPDAPRTLTIGLAQISLLPDLAGNLEKITRFIGAAAARGCRVVVFPEGALASPQGTPGEAVEAALDALSRAAAEAGIYVITGLLTPHPAASRLANALVVISPRGERLQTYYKLYDVRPGRLPGLFHIDGIPCSAIICADRWIRGVEDLPAVAGARVLFECSNNYPAEWIPDLGWYWYAPRALRNGAYVVFVNTSPYEVPGGVHGHGHSAIVAPDGETIVAGDDARDVLLVGEVDLSCAAPEMACRRAHPLTRAWWDAGLRLLGGKEVAVPPVPAYRSEARDVTVAVAQLAPGAGVEENVREMLARLDEAAARGADVVLFPELAVTGPARGAILATDAATLGRALARLRAAAAAHRVYAAFGMPHLAGDVRYNAAYVVGPGGDVITRYDQMVVDRPDLFAPGVRPAARWCRVRGVVTALSLGWREALWSEISELAALGGAELRLHLSSAAGGPEKALRRRQAWVNLASYRTLTAVANAAGPGGGGSEILEDYRRHRGADYSPYCAVTLARAGEGPALLVATERVEAANPHLRRYAEGFNTQMAPWYALGGHAIRAATPLADVPPASPIRA